MGWAQASPDNLSFYHSASAGANPSYVPIPLPSGKAYHHWPKISLAWEVEQEALSACVPALPPVAWDSSLWRPAPHPAI